LVGLFLLMLLAVLVACIVFKKKRGRKEQPDEEKDASEPIDFVQRPPQGQQGTSKSPFYSAAAPQPPLPPPGRAIIMDNPYYGGRYEDGFIEDWDVLT
jgi:hypothetical protein